MSFHFSEWVIKSIALRKINRHEHFSDNCLKESILQYGGKEAGSSWQLAACSQSSSRERKRACKLPWRSSSMMTTSWERSCSSTRRGAAPPQGEELLLHKERSKEQSAASLGPASSRRCSTLPAVGPGVPLDSATHKLVIQSRWRLPVLDTTQQASSKDNSAIQFHLTNVSHGELSSTTVADGWSQAKRRPQPQQPTLGYADKSTWENWSRVCPAVN